MISIRNILSIAFIVIFIIPVSMAQNSANTSGGEAQGNGGSCSYSVGQTFYTSQSGSNGSVSQGVQQAYEISIVTETESLKNITLNMVVYPNPTSDILMLSITRNENDLIFYELTDISGKSIEKQNITLNETSISTTHLSPGTYFLTVQNNKKEIKTFKIIKN